MRGWRNSTSYAVAGVVMVAGVAFAAAATPPERESALADSQVLQGRYLVVSHDCGGCHGGDDDPGRPGWLAGVEQPEQVFQIGPCALKPGAKPCYHTRPRNLTPDDETGLGRFTERQIFNALRYGLRPEDTPDVDITSTTPGEGNYPLHPHYLAPPMPWPAWRHMRDSDLRAIAAYLKRGLKPVHNRVKESEGPPDFWAGFYHQKPGFGVPGPYPVRPFPTANEQGGQ